MPRELFLFLGVVAVLTITPGPDMALVLRNGVRGGSRARTWLDRLTGLVLVGLGVRVVLLR